MIKFTRLSGLIGADVHGIDLSQPLNQDDVNAIREGLLEHLVLFFREQKLLTPAQQKALANHFGDLENSFGVYSEDDANVEYFEGKFEKQQTRSVMPYVPFHADLSYMPNRPLGAMLQAHVIPAAGGDTCYASMYAAYDALSAPMQTMLEGLNAVHSIARMASTNPDKIGDPELLKQVQKNPPAKLPVVHRHPDTGRKFLNVNPIYTTHIDGLHPEESDLMLKFLYEHVRRPEFEVRMHWNVGDLAFWDNWSTQHSPIQDWGGHRRMQRVSILRRDAGNQAAHQAA